MTHIAFFLGLALGIVFYIWRSHRLYRQLRQTLGLLHCSTEALSSLPLMAQLRRAISLANGQQQNMELQLQTWQQLLSVAPLGYLQVDEENQLVWCNPLARQMLQIERWEPKQMRLLLEVVRSYELDRLIEQTRHQQQPGEQEWVFYPACADATAMAEVRSLTLRAASYPLPEGQVGVFLENRQSLVELSQSRDRWISDLAHEFRTPLTSIHLVTQTLQQRLTNPTERRWAEQMLQEINRLINLVQDSLELAHLEGDLSRQNLIFKPLDLKQLINSVWQTLEPLAQQKQLTLAYFGPDALNIKANQARLTQVFLNLFDNSIKYSPPQQQIKIEINLYPVEDVPKLIYINIVDCGQGFLESDLPHVFDRLYRGDPSRARQETSALTTNRAIARTSGSGLGLAIVRQIILAHGGSIKAKNHPETGGAWLQIELPIN